MSKVMLALGSFIVGACCAFIISSGIQTSTWAQFSTDAASIPIVPPLKGFVMKNSDFNGGSLQLDGLDCENCTIGNTDFTYGGGAFRLVNPKFKTGMRITFTGAALNTRLLLILVEALNKPQRPVPPSTFKRPPIESATFTEPATIELISTAVSK